MEIKKTNRGFPIVEFRDRYDVKCSLQISSLAAADRCIWFGCEGSEIQIMVPKKGWTNIPMPENCHMNTRMHLSQSLLKELLPHLIKFADTGEIDLDPERPLN